MFVKYTSYIYNYVEHIYYLKIIKLAKLVKITCEIYIFFQFYKKKLIILNRLKLKKLEIINLYCGDSKLGINMHIF